MKEYEKKEKTKDRDRKKSKNSSSYFEKSEGKEDEVRYLQVKNDCNIIFRLLVIHIKNAEEKKP